METLLPTLRNAIIAEKGYTFLALDASQIELRVLAILSQDPQMLADLETGDLHMATAIRMFGLVEDEDTMKQRRYDAKQCNFAVVYGAEEFKLARMFNCSEAEALQFMADHRAAYPVLYTWMESKVEEAKENGYVVNMFGRIRPLPDLASPNFRIREHAEREVVNTVIQGSAVDIVKLAMLYLKQRFDPRIRLVLQVHDEMVWEIPDELLPQAIETSYELDTYFPDYPFSRKTGTRYGSMEEVDG